MSRSEQAGLAGLFALTVFACSVDTHERCDDNPTACPVGFYCDGEWCFPNGIGPGAADGTVDVDAEIDAQAETGDADVGPAFDMRMDGASDMPDQRVSDVIGAFEPADRVVSGAVSGRDTIRVTIIDAFVAEYTLVAPNTACLGWTDVDVEGVLVIDASEWQAFGSEGRFDLCVRAGGDELRFSAFEIDEVAPSLIGFSSGQNVIFRASEPLSAAGLGLAGCGALTPLNINDDTRDASTLTAPDGLLGIRLTDAIGNRSSCLELTRVAHVCALDSTLTPGIAPRPLQPRGVVSSTCAQVNVERGELTGTCATCALLERADSQYVVISIEARRPRLAVPTVYATDAGNPRAPDSMLDIALVNPDLLLMTDSTRIEFWARAGGIFRPGMFGFDMRASGIAPMQVVDGGTQIAIANPGDIPGFAIVDETLASTRAYRDGDGLRVSHLLSLSDTLSSRELAGLRGEIATVFSLNGTNWDVATIRRGVTQLARLNLRGLVMATRDNQVHLYEEGDPGDFNAVANDEMNGPIGCLATGDWTGNGQDDVIVCVGDTLVILPVQRAVRVGFADPITIPVGAGALQSLAIGDADLDGRPDALVLDVTGQVRLVINAPGNPVHLLDAPHSIRALRALGDANGPLDVALLPRIGRWVSRWTSPAAPIEPIAHAIELELNEEVVGVGDLDCDQRTNIVVRDSQSRVFKVLRALDLEALTLLPPADKTADAVGLGDLNGDGWPDVAAWKAGELQYWRAQPQNRLTRSAQPTEADRVDALTLGDWSGLGLADVVLRDGTELTHYHREPGEAVLLTQRVRKTVPQLLGFAIANLDATPALELFVGRRTTQNAFSLADFMRFGGAAGGTPMAGLIRTVVAPVAGTPRLFTLQLSADRETDVIETGEVVVMTGHLLDLAVGDFDMDGRHEVVVLAEADDQERFLQVLAPDSDGQYVMVGDPEPVLAEVSAIRAGDLDGDGRLDVIRFTQ